MLKSLVSWPAIGILAMAYWIALFIAVRARGRRAFEQEFARSQTSVQKGRAFTVAVPYNVSQIVAGVFIGPVALALLRFVAFGGLR